MSKQSTNSESHTPLPPGWTWTTLDQILQDLQSGKRPKGGVQGISSGIPSIGGEHLNNHGGFDFSTIKFVPESFAESMARGKIAQGDIIVVKDGATTAKTSYVGSDFPFEFAVINEHLFICRTFPSINPKYVFYYLWSDTGRKHILLDFRGAAQGGISTAFVNKVPLPLPPLPEQRRIVAKIEELFSKLDAGVAALKNVKAALKRYRQAVLKYAFEGKLTQQWREAHKDALEPASVLLERIKQERKARLGTKYKELPPPDTSDLPNLPEGWAWTTSTDLCSSVRDGTHTTPAYVDEGVPLVTSKNLKNGIIDFSTTRNISVKNHEEIKVRSGVETGDVIMAMIGTVGNPVVVRTNQEFSIKNVALFKKNESILSSDYLKYWLESPEFSNLLESKYLKGTTQKFIPLEHLRILPIPFTILEEQHQIVSEIERRFSVADAVERVVDQSLQQSERLRQSILKRAFEGKLVPQDPTDEPAEKLLERIRQEKAKQLTAKQTKKRKEP